MDDLEQLAKWLLEEASRHSISIAWRDPVIQEHVCMLRSWADLVDQAARRTAPDREAWISVDERRPENDQPVAFVVKAEKGSTNEHLNGRILGGTYHRDWGFSTPGIGFIASHWMPLPAAPTSDKGGA